MTSLRKAHLVPALAGLLGLAACEIPPPVAPTADKRQQAERVSRIEGEVVVQGASRGNAVLFLYAKERPPPTGRPVAFTVIPGEKVFGGALNVSVPGVYTAPFSFSLVKPGDYLIRGFLDADSCLVGASPCRASDFNPWYGVTAEPNKGDVGGGAADLATRALVPIHVTAERPATEVSVIFQESATTVVPADRPAFQVASAVNAVTGQPAGTGSPVAGATLQAPAPIVLTLTPQNVEGSAVSQAGTFLVRYVDDNGDGQPDDNDRDGKPDLWPKVIVRKLAETTTLLLDENDLDKNGVLDEGPSVVDNNADGAADLTVLAAGWEPDTYNTLRSNLDAAMSMGYPFIKAPALKFVVLPRALDMRTGTPTPFAALPKGKYAVILLSFTGQSWRTPNELSPKLASAIGLPATESQVFYIDVP